MVTEGSNVAEDQVAAKGHTEAKSRVAAKSQVATKCQDQAQCHDQAEGQVQTKSEVAAKGRVAVDKADNGKINCFCVDDGLSIFLAIILDYLFPFSLTKYSAIFVEVKGYFGINDN